MNWIHDKLTNGLIHLFIGISNVAGGLAHLAPSIAAWIMLLTMIGAAGWIGYHVRIEWVN